MENYAAKIAIEHGKFLKNFLLFAQIEPLDTEIHLSYVVTCITLLLLVAYNIKLL